MNKDILVYCEQRDGIIQNVSYELLGKATQLAETCGGRVCALFLGYNIAKSCKQLIEHGAQVVYYVDDKNFEYYLTEQYAQATSQIIEKYKPNIVLFPATSIGRDLAPRLSARLHTGLTADCTKLETNEDGDLFMTRPAFGGNLFATIICPNSRPQMSTVRQGVMQKLSQDSNRQGEVVKEQVTFDKNKFLVNLIEEKIEKSTEEQIEDSKVLVSVGRGMQKYIDQAEKIAKLLGGVVSCSRAVVDEGILPQNKQVGQTGKTVRPTLYLALGISGAVQHLAGMSDSDFIIAVNKDKDATIFNVAHVGIVGDAAAILPNLEKEIVARQ